MTELDASLVTIGVLCFIAGLIIGAVLHRFLQTETIKNRRLVQQLDQIKEQHSRYQAEVSDHFAKTADLFAKLNSNYRDLLNHLATSANKLSDDVEFSRTANLAPPTHRYTGVVDVDSERDAVEPPRDYAPRNKAEDKGTLSEGFGMDSTGKA